MSAVVSPASSIAARQPSSVSSSGSRKQPAPDLGLADAGDARAPFDDLVRVHHALPLRLEQREVHVAVGIGDDART